MRTYNEGRALVDLLKDLVERDPINVATAPLWFEVAFELLAVAWEIRRQSWHVMSREDRDELIRRDPRVKQLDMLNEFGRFPKAREEL